MRDLELFPLTNHLHEGDRVHYRRTGVQYRHNALGEGDGVIELIWLSTDEMIDIRRTDGFLFRVSAGEVDIKRVDDVSQVEGRIIHP